MKKADIIKMLHDHAEIRYSTLKYNSIYNKKITLYKSGVKSACYGCIDQYICSLTDKAFNSLLSTQIIKRVERCNNYDVYMLKEGTI